jgi:hypothetical protein
MIKSTVYLENYYYVVLLVFFETYANSKNNNDFNECRRELFTLYFPKILLKEKFRNI